MARERLDRLWEAAYGGPDDEDGEEFGGEPFSAIDEEEEEELGEPELVPGPREGQRETVQARALLEKAERLLERLSPEDRIEVERLMGQVHTALTDRKWDRVTSTSNELSDILFYLEDA
jgi:molecular chaperone DnaK